MAIGTARTAVSTFLIGSKVQVSGYALAAREAKPLRRRDEICHDSILALCLFVGEVPSPRNAAAYAQTDGQALA